MLGRQPELPLPFAHSSSISELMLFLSTLGGSTETPLPFGIMNFPNQQIRSPQKHPEFHLTQGIEQTKSIYETRSQEYKLSTQQICSCMHKHSKIELKKH